MPSSLDIKKVLNYTAVRGIDLSRLNSAQERSLQVINDDQYSLFAQLLRIKDDSTIHQQNIQIII